MKLAERGWGRGWSTSLLHSIIQFSIPSLLIAFLILKYVPVHSIPIRQQTTSFVHRQQAPIATAPSPSLPSSRRAAPGHGAHSQKAEMPRSPSPSSLHPNSTDWDRQRLALLARSAPLTHLRRFGDGGLHPATLLVTGSSPIPCINPLGDHLLLRFIKNKIDYCRLHGIDIFYNMALLNREMPDCWAKLPVLRKLMLSHPEVDWIWWMDSDAFFTDMTFELPWEKYEQYNLVVPGWDGEVYGKKSWLGLNAGIFLIRNCQWSLDFMDAWEAFGRNQKVRDEFAEFFSKVLVDRPVFEGDDQAALVHVLNTQKEKWGMKVLLENSYYLHGYWGMIVDRYEEMMQSSHPGYGDERWPLVTHFVGCKPCGIEALKERCVKQMERAFNFADNQVLQHYGFGHTNLGTEEVNPVATKRMGL